MLGNAEWGVQLGGDLLVLKPDGQVIFVYGPIMHWPMNATTPLET